MSDSARSGHMLEGDGIVSNLYYYLWKKRMTSDTTGVGMDQHTTAELCIPSTVIFEHNFPKAWYYHTEQTKDIERKLGKDVDSQQILKEFTKAGSRGSAGKPALTDDDGDVVATYYSSQEDAKGRACTRVEFFDKERLQHFLLRRARRPDGFLQKWVLNTGKHNTVVQAIWSPHVCLVNKRQNCAPIRDKNKNLYERAVTYEGPTHHSTEVFVAPHIKWQVKCVCEELVEHLAKTQRVAISRMVLYFKVDHASDIWLLYCSSLRVTDRSQLNLAPEYIRDAKDEGKQESMTARRIARLLKETFDDDREDGDAKGAEDGVEFMSTNPPPSRRHSPTTIKDVRTPHAPQPVAHPATRPGIRRPTTTANAKPRNPKAAIPRGAFGNIMEGMKWPKPPSMGSIGDIYTEYPNWTVRKQQTDEGRKLGCEYTTDGRKERYQTRRRRFDVQRADGTIQKAYETPEPAHKYKGKGVDGRAVQSPDCSTRSRKGAKKKGMARSGNGTRPGSARERGDGGVSPFQPYNASALYQTTVADTQEVSFPGDQYPASRDAKLLWRVLRLAVLSGYAVQRHHRVQLHDWVRTMQYCVYSHFLSHRTPMMLQIPVVYGEMLTELSRAEKRQLKQEAAEREEARIRRAVQEEVVLSGEDSLVDVPGALAAGGDEGPATTLLMMPPGMLNKPPSDLGPLQQNPASNPAPASSDANEISYTVPMHPTQEVRISTISRTTPRGSQDELHSRSSSPESTVQDGGGTSGGGFQGNSSSSGDPYSLDPTEWLSVVGLEIMPYEQEQKNTSGTLLLDNGQSSVITVRVKRLCVTFLKLQSRMEALLRARLDRSFVVLWWHYVAHHWLITRHTQRPSQIRGAGGHSPNGAAAATAGGGDQHTTLRSPRNLAPRRASVGQNQTPTLTPRNFGGTLSRKGLK